VHLARSTEIYFLVDGTPPSIKSKHEPNASFWHGDAQYPGVIVEVAYLQKMLDRLAEDYLLDSDASVQVVVGLDIEYGKKGSRKATWSVCKGWHLTDCYAPFASTSNLNWSHRSGPEKQIVDHA